MLYYFDRLYGIDHFFSSSRAHSAWQYKKSCSLIDAISGQNIVWFTSYLQAILPRFFVSARLKT